MLKEKKVLAIIPARGGSKGIQRKNLQVVGDLSLVARVAQLACSIEWIDKVIISTDDPDIAYEGQRFGALFLGQRPVELSSDTSCGFDVWMDALITCEEHYKENYDISLYLQPTSPFRTRSHIEATVSPLLGPSSVSSVITVSRLPASHHPNKLFRLLPSGKITKYTKGSPEDSNRQMNNELFIANGICYAATRKQILETKKIYDKDSFGILIEDDQVNIDDPFDLKVAQLLF